MRLLTAVSAAATQIYWHQRAQCAYDVFCICGSVLKLGGIMDHTMIPSGVQTAVQVAANARLILFLE